MKKHVAIIGAGITGLSAAYYLKKQNPDLQVSIYEASGRAGGKIQTYRKSGYTIELGAESFLGRKQIMIELAEELGLGDDLITNETGQSYIYAKNQLYPIPGGAIMGIPTDIKPFLTTQLISPLGKLRAGFDYFKKPVDMPTGDISMGAFFRRRLGNEVLEHLIEPLMSGIYGTNIDELSLMSTFPNFRERECKFGSLIKGMRYEKAQRTKARQLYPGAPKGQFKQFRHGLASFIEALVDKLEEQGVVIHYKHPVTAVETEGKQPELTIKGQKMSFDGVIIATSHRAFAPWFAHDHMFDYFKNMATTSVATVAMAFDERDITNVHDGTGFVIARSSNTNITACTWTTKKWPFTTPDGKVLIRAYIGKPTDTVVADHTNEELALITLNDLKQMMHIKGDPEFTIVNRLMHSMPQYHVGHAQHIAEIKSHIRATYPRLRVTGASFDAVGLPDCISQAKHVAEEIQNQI